MWPFGRRTAGTGVHERALFNIGDMPMVSNTRSGVRVTPETAQALPALYACVRVVAELSSMLPIHAYRTGSREPVDPAPRVLDEPAAGWPWGDWCHAVLRSALTTGNQWGLIVDRDGASLRPSQVELLADGRVTVRTEIDHARGGYRHAYRLDGREVDRDTLWHFRGHTAAGSVLGLSPVAYARECIGQGLGAARFGADFFGSDAVPIGVIEDDGTNRAALGNQDQLDAAVLRWSASRGTKRSTAALAPGLKWRQVSIPPEDSQFLETQRWTAQEVCSVFGVPPEEIGQSSGNSMTYGNIETRGIALLRYGLDPWLVRLERAVTRDFLPRGQYAKFTRAGLLRTDTLTRLQAYEIGLRTGIYTRAEVREWEDLAPLPAGTVPPALEVVA
jgi:HK97 family phage portal protein